MAETVTLHWFVDDFAQRKQLDTIVRWLIAIAPAVCVSDAHNQTVVYAERVELPLKHEWMAVRFRSGLVLRVAAPIDVSWDVFDARLDDATEFIRVLFDEPSRVGRSGPSSAGGSGPADAHVFMSAPSRRKG
ncbi:MAG: hypothetical protein U0269_31555 [Polyangiales bacterium]